MINLVTWATRHGVSAQALEELRMTLGVGALMPDPAAPVGKSGSEAYQASLIRIAAAQRGDLWLSRNNVGALMDVTGRSVRYGLANETPHQNKVVKSGDLIGIRSFVIQSHHVGQTFGQFVSIETKEKGWQYSGTPHEVAQQNWATFVVSKGGAAGFAYDPSHLQGILQP